MSQGKRGEEQGRNGNKLEGTQGRLEGADVGGVDGERRGARGGGGVGVAGRERELRERVGDALLERVADADEEHVEALRDVLHLLHGLARARGVGLRLVHERVAARRVRVADDLQRRAHGLHALDDRHRRIVQRAQARTLRPVPRAEAAAPRLSLRGGERGPRGVGRGRGAGVARSKQGREVGHCLQHTRERER